MRIYFDVSVVDDEILKDLITDRQVELSSEFIEDTALGLGVLPEAIKDPTPFKIRQLAEAYALMEIAKKQSIMCSGSMSSEAGADAYELKRRVYAAEVNELLKQITADTFTGGKSSPKRAFPMSVPLYRR